MGLSRISIQIRKTLLCRALLAALTGAMPLSAVADETAGYWYGGAGIGRTDTDGGNSELIASPFPGLCTTFPCHTDDSGYGYKLFAGYQFTELLGLEAEYARLSNTLDVQSVDSTTVPTGILGASQDSQVFALRGVLTKRIYSPISISAVVGVGLWKSDIDTVLVGPALNFAASDQSHGFRLNFGARVNYDISDQLRLRGSWDRYTNLGDSSAATIKRPGLPLVANTVHTRTDLFSIDLVYRFR